MKTMVFAGPTLFGNKQVEFAVYPPARLGSVMWALREGARRIVIIDGYFGNVPAVWHKEILWALSEGCEVWGAGSMGALRAAELSDYGMRGFGKVFDLYSSGALSDDDEVCVLHCGSEALYMPLSESLVNVRFTLERLRSLRAIDEAIESQIIHLSKQIHFADRTRDRLASVFTSTLGQRHGAIAWNSYVRYNVNQKADDAVQLLQNLSTLSAKQGDEMKWVFPSTFYWKQQFIDRVDELPPGDLDPFDT